MVRRWWWLVVILIGSIPLRAVTISHLRNVDVPATVDFALDVRWSGEHSVLLAAGRAGVVEIDLRSPHQVKAVVAGGALPRAAAGRISSFFFSALLGASPDYLVVGSPFRAFAWRSAATDHLTEVPFANMIDLDVWRNRAVILGVRGDAMGRWRSVGATAWSATLTAEAARFEPLPGPDVPLIQACHLLSMGSVRFLPDGRFVIAPGVDRGVFLYDLQGRMIRSWPTDDLGYEDRCSVTVEQGEAFADLEPRRLWQNRRELLDEMLVLPEGPLLMIRQPGPDGTRWRGVLLPYDGKPRNVSIPLRSPSPHAHLRGDVRGERIVLAIFENRRPEEPRKEKRSLFIGKVRP